MGFPIPPQPVTWASGTVLTAPQLRADASNLAWLLTRKPVFLAAATGLQTASTGVLTPVFLGASTVDNWAGGGAAASPTYTAKFSGWYLCEGDAFIAGTAQTGSINAGIQAVQENVTSSLQCGYVVPDGVHDTNATACDLVQLISQTADTCALLAYQTVSATQNIDQASYLKTEWAALPSTTYTALPLVTGTVVTSPQAAALWPPGAGTFITNGGGIAAGATSMTVQNSTGMVNGGTLGLEYYEGQATSAVAETVTISSVTGLTIGISATTYPHAQNAPVAVPVSAAFMNQQVRDVVNFLAYPPILRLSNFGGSQSIPNQVFPAATAVNFQTATVDNFSGWSGTGTSTYTFPVSGVYFVYGQVFYQASVFNCHAGISIAGGTVLWGDSIRTGSTSLSLCPTVRKVVRVTAGQTLQLMTCNGAGGAISLLVANSTAYSTLVAVWQGF